MKAKLLIIAHETLNREILSLPTNNVLHIYHTEDHEHAINILNDVSPDIVILDLDIIQYTSGTVERLQIIDYLFQQNPFCTLIVIIGDKHKAQIDESLLLRSYDILEKPININDLRSTIDRAIRRINLRSKAQAGYATLNNKEHINDIIGQSSAIQQIKKTIRSIANTSASVLITGESGTGKEIVARAIHNQSTHHNNPFIVVNAGAIPENLLESELFGFEKGAFTGAVKSKKGKFEIAEGGTLFLDEIGNMSPSLQCKILRAIENREIERLGATHIIPLNVRIIAATNRDLCNLIKQSLFREDLYYRLNVINIFIPPLRARMDDLPELTDHFLKKYARRENKEIGSLSLAAMEVLGVYQWPGNVRELEHVIERATILCNGHEIELDHLPPEIVGDKGIEDPEIHRYTEAVNAFKKLLITRTMEETGYNKTITARKLGLNRTYLFKLMKELELN